MPSYDTHAIHGSNILSIIDKKIEIEEEDFKVYCMGPDLLTGTNFAMFSRQHRYGTRLFFFTLMNIIKERKLRENSEVMAFLYGQLDHFVLDVIMHPYIYYITEGLPSNTILGSHGIAEHAIDNFIRLKYGIKIGHYFHKLSVNDDELKSTINEVYSIAYGQYNVANQYNMGIKLIRLYDLLVRRDKTHIVEGLSKLVRLGEAKYRDDDELARWFFRRAGDVWYHPETGEECHQTFDDLWEISFERYRELIENVNGYIYDDKEISDPFIIGDLSYNTGLPCDRGQTNQFVKR